MEIGGWTLQDWFNLFSAFGIVGSLLFSAYSLRSESKTRRIANLLSITANHREIWKVYLGDKQLARVLDDSVDISKQPATDVERTFVSLMFLHINSVYFARKDEMIVTLEGWRRDIAQFLALPIPRDVWEKMKSVQNDEFAAFVESCRNWK